MGIRKDITMDFKKLTGSKRFKYGSVAVAFSCVFVAMILLLNVIISALSDRFSLYVDMTGEEFYTVSEETVAQLSEISSPVEIVFFQNRDKISEGTYFGRAKSLAHEYANNFDNITVKYIDLISQPTAANKYKMSSADSITQSTVVVHCAETGRSKIIQADGFYTFSVDNSGKRTGLYGFNGEKRFTSCILQVTSSIKPLALLTTGHDETASGNLYTILTQEGYEVAGIDLTREEIPENCQMLIISNPMRDFAGLEAEKNGGTNEIKMINSFLIDKNGSALVFLSPEMPQLPELSEYLSEWGISYSAGQVLTDSPANTIDTGSYQIIGNYCGDSDSFEYQLHAAASEDRAKVISSYNVPLTLSEVPGRTVANVLVASADCVSHDGENTTAAPNSPLLALSSRSRTVNNEEMRSNILCFASPYFFDSAYDISAYGNTDILYGAMKMFGNSAVSIGIDTKPFHDTTLDITNATANTVMTIICAVIPMIILVFGIVVWRKRKSK